MSDKMQNYNNPPSNNNNNNQGSPEQNAAIQEFWAKQMENLEGSLDFKNHPLPLARIKKVMKSDPEVKQMVSSEAPFIFSKACEIFISELTMRAWLIAEENKRRTLQRSDIATAVSKSDQYDFLIDIVPREEINYRGKASKQSAGNYELGMTDYMAPPAAPGPAGPPPPGAMQPPPPPFMGGVPPPQATPRQGPAPPGHPAAGPPQQPPPQQPQQPPPQPGLQPPQYLQYPSQPGAGGYFPQAG